MDRTGENRAYAVFTAMKFVEMAIGVYASYIIISRIKFQEPLYVIYITMPTYSLISFTIGIERIIFRKKMYIASVFEIAVCLTGFVLHMISVIVMMYYLPRVDYVEPGEEGTVTQGELYRFGRTIKSAVSSTVVAVIYLLDGFLSVDSLLARDGFSLWTQPDYPIPNVDLPPKTPFHMVWPWESILIKESIFTKLYIINKSNTQVKDK